MSIVQFARFKSNNAEQVIKNARVAKKIFEKHGAEFLRLSRFHTSAWAGEWLITTRYSDWETYGKVQDAVAKDADSCRSKWRSPKWWAAISPSVSTSNPLIKARGGQRSAPHNLF